MKYYKFFATYFSNLKDISQQKVICPFHEDAEPSLSINLEKGFWKCFGCDKTGDIYTFYMLWHKCDFKTAKYEILGDVRIPVLSEGEVNEAHNTLINTARLITAIGFHRGWILSTVIKFQLGWNPKEKRIYIPIRDEHGTLRNIRKYDMFHTTKSKFTGVKGFNTPYFFPISNLVNKEHKFIILLGGEPDTILACQLGLIAGTFTGGEGNFNRNLLPLFTNKTVYICYDQDLHGYRGTKVIGAEISQYAKEVKIIDLPFTGEK